MKKPPFITPTCGHPSHREPLRIGEINYSAQQINELLSLIPDKADKKEVFPNDSYLGHFPMGAQLPDMDRFAWAFVGDLDKAHPYFYYPKSTVPQGYQSGWNDMAKEFGTYLLTPGKQDQLTAEELFKEKFRLPQLTADRAIADEQGNRITDTYVKREAVANHIKQIYNQQFLDNPPLITEGYITPEMLSEETKQMLEATGQEITNLPDGEDLQSVHGVLKLADKQYNPNAYSGLGRRILRKNIVAGVNVLTQSMMQWPNTIYIIQYDYDLQGETITVPEGCVLDFQGGKLMNGIVYSNKTVISGKPSAKFIGTIYDQQNDEIHPVNYRKKTKLLNIYSSVNLFDDVLEISNIEKKRRLFNNSGMNKLWLCILLEYDSSFNQVKVPNWYTKYHELGGLGGVVNYLRNKMNCNPVCIKLHKNYNFNDNINEPKAYERFCLKLIDEIVDLGIKTIFISNEEYERIIPGSIWIESFKNIINYAHSFGLYVGFSVNGWSSSVRDIDSGLLEEVDKVYENFYPSLNWKDEESSYSDLPMMIHTAYNQLLDHKSKLLKRKPTAIYGISECGVMSKTKALRFPWEYNQDKLGEDDVSGKILDLFWRSIIEAADKSGIHEISNWFLDGKNADFVQENTINYIFNKTW